jgi:hypothetical protein
MVKQADWDSCIPAESEARQDPNSVGNDLCPPYAFGNRTKHGNSAAAFAAECCNPLSPKQDQNGSTIGRGPNRTNYGERSKITRALPISEPPNYRPMA